MVGGVDGATRERGGHLFEDLVLVAVLIEAAVELEVVARVFVLQQHLQGERGKRVRGARRPPPITRLWKASLPDRREGGARQASAWLGWGGGRRGWTCPMSSLMMMGQAPSVGPFGRTRQNIRMFPAVGEVGYRPRFEGCMTSY